MTTQVRPMTASDLDAVTSLASGSAGAPLWTRQIYEDAIGREESSALVAVDGELIAGFAIAEQVLDIGQLESIVVSESFRRQGIGSTLLQGVIDWSRSRNCCRLELEVRAGNGGAITLYEQAGFLRDGLRHAYYRNPEEDAVLMSLNLDLSAKTVEKNP